MSDHPDKVTSEPVPSGRLDPLDDLQLLERLHTELSARIYCTHNDREKFRLLALQSEIEAVLEHR